MCNFYDEYKLPYPERAILLEDVNLPELPKMPNYPLTHDYFKQFSEYQLAFNYYKDIKAKFIIPILTPLAPRNEPIESEKNAPNTTRNRGNILSVSPYKSTNYISLIIPKYILMNFRKKIRKGTEFLVVSVGGEINVEDFRIIGIYTLPTPNPEEYQ